MYGLGGDRNRGMTFSSTVRLLVLDDIRIWFDSFGDSLTVLTVGGLLGMGRFHC